MFLIISLLILVFCIYAYSVHNKNTLDGTFESYRLGNAIDLWYFSNFENLSKRKSKELSSFPTKKNNCFSYHLINNRSLINKPKNIDLKGEWPIYYYDNITKCLDNFQFNLKQMMSRYDSLNDGKLFSQNFNSDKHCIIHYRLGDVVTLGDAINYTSIINVIEELKEKIDTIEILDGGQNHHPIQVVDGVKVFAKGLLRSDVSTSSKIYNDFYKSLNDKFPNINVIKSEKRTSDEDFFRMVSAPILITAAGSYAIAAAIAGDSKIIRTPSCKDLDHPKYGCLEKDIQLDKKYCDWKTYQYEIL